MKVGDKVRFNRVEGLNGWNEKDANGKVGIITGINDYYVIDIIGQEHKIKVELLQSCPELITVVDFNTELDIGG